MNLPNKLTVARIIMVPFFVVFLVNVTIPHHFLIAGLIFALASFTDLLDGKIARKRNLVTNFGKFLDPLADKILVISALVCFVNLGLAELWFVLIIIARHCWPIFQQYGILVCRKCFSRYFYFIYHHFRRNLFKTKLEFV